jgi:hypothetical protein
LAAKVDYSGHADEGGRKHWVPLSSRAIAILEALGEAKTGEFVFPEATSLGRSRTSLDNIGYVSYIILQ